MKEEADLARRFEEHRPRLKAVALRMLGAENEADDAVQEAWLRLVRSDSAAIENLGGWLTTTVSRLCLDLLRSRRSHSEESWDEQEFASPAMGAGPEDEAILADSLGPALLAVLETLSPHERVAFVLHDLFGVPFDDIGPVVDRSSDAARQLASRARRRLRGTDTDRPSSRGHDIVRAFLAAAREGNFEGLLAVLDPEASVRFDGSAAAWSGIRETAGARSVAEKFKGQARAAKPANVDGQLAAAWIHEGAPRVVLLFTLRGDRIVGIEAVADPERLRGMKIEVV
jgi:RNA polymerase sigma-70 factor (ECF subfamily)